MTKYITLGGLEAAWSNIKSYIDRRFRELINGAPEAFDTLKEIADALDKDKDGSIINSILTTINKKVDKVDGKGLSSNDYTTDEKNKLANTYTQGQTDAAIGTAVGAETTRAQDEVDAVATALQGQIDALNKKNQFDELHAEHMSADLMSAELFTGNLTWSYITDKPTTLSGYGITDGAKQVDLTAEVNRAKEAEKKNATAAANAQSAAEVANDNANTRLPIATFDDLFEKVNIGTPSSPQYAIRAKYGFYSDQFISAYGKSDTTASGGGSTFDLLQTWENYNAATAQSVALSAYLGYLLKEDVATAAQRITALEGGSAMSFTTEGDGNAVTRITKDGTTVTVEMSKTFLEHHQTVESADATLAWNQSVTIATIGGTAISVKLPKNPDTTYSNFTAATSATAGKSGLVSAPGIDTAGKNFFLRADNTWQEIEEVDINDVNALFV